MSALKLCFYDSHYGSSTHDDGDRPDTDSPSYLHLSLNMIASCCFYLLLFLGYIPPKAAGSYGDGIFGKLMWLKTTSVYIAIQAGFHVIFQDTDLVWIKNPIEHLYAQPYDIGAYQMPSS